MFGLLRHQTANNAFWIASILTPILSSTSLSAQDSDSTPLTVAMAMANLDTIIVSERAGEHMTVTGILTSDLNEPSGRARARIQDASRGIELVVEDITRLTRRYHRGDLVQVTGTHSRRRSGGERLDVEHMTLIATLPPPAPIDATSVDVLYRRYPGMLVRLHGKLIYTPEGPEEAKLLDEAGEVPVSVPEEMLLDVEFSKRVLEGRQVAVVGFAESTNPDGPLDPGFRVSIDEESDILFAPLPPYGKIILGVSLAVLVGLTVSFGVRQALARRRNQEMAALIAHLEETKKTLEVSERALRRSETHYRSLVDHSPFGVFRSTTDGKILSANPALVTMLGYDSPEELTGQELGHSFLPKESGADFDSPCPDGTPCSEAHWTRRDGTPVRLRIRYRLDAAAEGNGATVEAFVEDVTERQRLEDQLRQSQKMEAVGRLAGGVAHDFNNLLTVILSSTTFLLEDLPSGDSSREEVLEIKEAGERAAALTQQLLAFSRQQPLAPQILDVNQTVADTMKLLHRVVGEDVELVSISSPDVGLVEVDPGQLQQVILNLVVNARDAMPQGGILAIETSRAQLDDHAVRLMPGAVPGRYVVLSVTDNGVGMSTETQRRLFEPFFTTKEVGKGTGLGLATVYGIVKQSNGYISVESELGDGTTFKIYLPLVTETMHIDREEKPVRPKQGSETILLVEDQEAVRALARRALQRGGYKLLEAADGEAALALATQYHGEIDAMVTDVVMPGMSGRQLADRLSELRPNTRVLYVSGYTEDMIIRHGILKDREAFMSKPFTPDTLLLAVRALLDDRSREVQRLTNHHSGVLALA